MQDQHSLVLHECKQKLNKLIERNKEQEKGRVVEGHY